MRLIDADGFKNWLMERYVCFDHTLEDIDAQPTIDAVPVVRCKDCKNSRGKIANRTKCGLHNWWVGFDYYCADGERKDDEID